MRRVIELDGCLNFRDLGGYPTDDGRRVRWRRVFRADALHLLTRSDVSRIRDELKIRSVVDLRSTTERRADPARPLDAEDDVRVHHLPLFDGDTSDRGERRDAAELSLADRYLALARIAREPIARTIGIVADSRGASVFHCAAGKDRTGIVSALLLSVLGVRPEVIVADYAATRDNLEQIIDRLMKTEGYDSILGTLPADTLHADPETMVGLLEGIQKVCGSAHEYVRAAGVTDSTLRRLRAALLEER